MKTSTRKLLEQYVIACNKYLKEVVQNMDLIILLRNSHSIYRSNFAMMLYNENQISKEQVTEFTKVV